MKLLALPVELLHEILDKLKNDKSSLAAVSRTCHVLNDLAVPVLFYRVDLFFSGDYDSGALSLLDGLSAARTRVLSQIQEVRVIGYWFILFSEIESELGRVHRLGPAVRMLNIIMIQLVQRMPELCSFTWDLQVAPTQPLIDVLSRLPKLVHLSLRLGTDHTPYPYFFPEVRLHDFAALKSVSLFAIDSSLILDDLAAILARSQVERLTITAGNTPMGDSPLQIFSRILASRPLRFHALDVQGYDIYALPTMWQHLVPAALHDLTIKLPENSGLTDTKADEFWRAMISEESRIRYLCTDVVCTGLMERLGSSAAVRDSIQHLLLIPCKSALFQNPGLMRAFLRDVLPHLAGSLRTLALYTRDADPATFACSYADVKEIVTSCKGLKELALVVEGDQLEIVLGLLPEMKRLEALQLVSTNFAPDALFARYALQSIQSLPDLPLRLLGINFNQLYEFFQDGEEIMAEIRSLNFWENALDSIIFSPKLMEWW